MVVYLVPFVLGFGWSAYNPESPQLAGITSQGSRPSDGVITIESFGAGAMEVGLSAGIAEFVRKRALPLWNPHHGLGQPFAAMGDGNPYWPPRVLRALLPYPLENLVAFLSLPLSGLAMVGLLRLLGASSLAAAVGGCLWITSGSLSMHLARPSIFDQVAMLPVLFFALALAMKCRTHSVLLFGGCAAAGFALSGFPQIGVVGMAAAFLFVLSNTLRASPIDRLRSLGFGVGALALGGGFAAFYLVSLAGTVLTAWEPRGGSHGFLQMPLVNLASFFFPVLSGQPLHNWMPGGYPNVTDWNNLYGHSSIVVAVLLCFGMAACKEMPREKKVTFLFFFGCGLALYLKYVSLPPFSLFNYIPLIGTITPKHVNGVTAFLFTVAAALSLDHLRRKHLKSSLVLVSVFLIGSALLLAHTLYLVRGIGPYDASLAAASIGLTLLLVIGGCSAIAFVAEREGSIGWREGYVLLSVILAEAVAYLLLGNVSISFVWGRIAVVTIVLFAGWAVAVGRIRTGMSFAISAVIAYSVLIFVPASGLPNRVDLLKVEPYMEFLKKRDADQYRTFGINADFSAIGDLNDISAAGPLAPFSFKRFVELVGGDEMSHFYNSAIKFWLDTNLSAPHLAISQYLAMKPLFDWVGVKYVILEKNHSTILRRTDYRQLLNGPAALPIVYEDAKVIVLMSATAKPKAEFYPSVLSYRSDDQIAVLRSNPALVDKWAFVSDLKTLPEGDNGPPIAADVRSDRPNYTRVVVESSKAGILVVKQALSPGWSARVNGNLTEIIPVAGILQGVSLSAAGKYDVEFSYRPPGFWVGVTISFAALIAAFGFLAWVMTGRCGTLLESDIG